jgi:hypothetical protein
MPISGTASHSDDAVLYNHMHAHHRTGNLTLRELYKHLLQPHQFPTSAKYWKALAQLEIAEGDTPAVEAVFEKCLPLVSESTCIYQCLAAAAAAAAAALVHSIVLRVLE